MKSGNGKPVEVSAGNRRVLERVPAQPQVPGRLERGHPGGRRESDRPGGQEVHAENNKDRRHHPLR